LCAVELIRGEYFPVFLELRRVQPNQTLVQGIIMAFRVTYNEMNKAGFLVQEVDIKCNQIAKTILDAVKNALSLIEHEEQEEGILKLLE
jgi:translation initiation factor IF-2